MADAAAKKRKSASDKARYRRLREAELAERPPDLITELSESEAAYIAGLIDGEGSIYVMRTASTCYPAVSIVMTHRDVIHWLAARLGISACRVVRKEPRWADQWTARIHGSRAQLLCQRMLPHLRVKRLQAELLLTFPGEERRGRGVFLAADVQKRRAALRQQINKLNARGPKDG